MFVPLSPPSDIQQGTYALLDVMQVVLGIEGNIIP
jgi:hypothetical protein